MRLAAVDIGTNSVLLLVAERGADGGFHALEDRCEITRIGRGVDASGELQSAAMERTLAVVARFAERAHQLDVAGLEIVGTSALRDARNGPRFLELVLERVGEEVTIISGQREAELVLAGVNTSFGALPAGSLVFDVGGGSTELIAVDPHGGVAALRSIDVGSVRLTERFIAHDPPRRDELRALKESVRTALSGLPSSLHTLYREATAPLLVGVSGTVTTLYAIEVGMTRYDASRVDGSTLDSAQLRELAARLAALSLHERRKLPGLEPQRADVIVAGSLIVAEIMDFVGSRALYVADRGVRWGLISEGASRKST